MGRNGKHSHQNRIWRCIGRCRSIMFRSAFAEKCQEHPNLPPKTCPGACALIIGVSAATLRLPLLCAWQLRAEVGYLRSGGSVSGEVASRTSVTHGRTRIWEPWQETRRYASADHARRLYILARHGCPPASADAGAGRTSAFHLRSRCLCASCWASSTELSCPCSCRPRANARTNVCHATEFELALASTV